jgi:hypothetical protein
MEKRSIKVMAVLAIIVVLMSLAADQVCNFSVIECRSNHE